MVLKQRIIVLVEKIAHNGSVVEKVGALAATSLSHRKLLLKYEKLSYLRIRPNFLNHVLAVVFISILIKCNIFRELPII